VRLTPLSTRETLTLHLPSWLRTWRKPKAFKGGFVRGFQEVRAYWTEQWSEINPHVEPISFYSEEAGRILVDVHQVVRDEAGAVLADEHVGHRFTLEHSLIQAMEVCPLPSSTPHA
jgi:formylmethanofuran dehydrogenase subunit A